MVITLYATLQKRLEGYEQKLAQLKAIRKKHPIRYYFLHHDIDLLAGQIKELSDILLIIKSQGSQD